MLERRSDSLLLDDARRADRIVEGLRQEALLKTGALQNAILTSGPITQSQPNFMVQLPNGSFINPGLVASFYTHGYPQSYIDRLLNNEFGGISA